MASYASIFGETLLSKNGPVDVATLNDKYVAVYFSAHWCGPCKAFTPILRKVYLKLQKQGTPFEVVFCSKDMDQKGFDEYYGAMPWLAVDFKNEEVRNNLMGLFEVTGIPRLVMLSPEGVINPNAKQDVVDNEDGFPWKQPEVKDLVEPNVVDKSGSPAAASLADKVVGLYFSAHWCGPCKAFTPVLIETYNQLKAEGKNFEVVFCSLDNDAGEYKEYYGSMPWMTLGYQNKAVDKLKAIIGVEGIPCLVLCDENLVPYSGDGVAVVKSEGVAGFPWMPNAVKDLNVEPDDINERACLIVFMDNDNVAIKDAAIQVLEDAAPAIKDAVSIFYVKEAGDVSNQIRSMLVMDDCPLMTIVNIPDNGAFYLPASQEITGENVIAFVQSFTAGQCERKQMTA